MSFIHAQFAPEFEIDGGDVVLLAMDTPGVRIFLAALRDALQRGASQLIHKGTTQKFHIRTGVVDIEFGDNCVVWYLDRTTAAEIEECLDTFSGPDRPQHQYLDIDSPAETLVLSHDKYTAEYFEQLPEELRYAKPPGTPR